MKPTIYEVAKEAGVSIATVSKVINDLPVGKKIKKRVQEVINDLNGKPSLMGKQTSAIGFLLPDLGNPFMVEMAKKVEERAHEKGYNLLICGTDFNKEKEAAYVSLLRQKGVEGFIFAGGFKNTEVVEQLVEEGIPVSLLSESYPHLSMNSIIVDDFMGGYQAASHLISLGHERIAVIAEDAKSSRERIEGYKQALRDKGLKVDEHQILISDSTIEDAIDLAHLLLQGLHPPTAIFGCNDTLAMGALLAGREKGLRIPEDLSIIGFDNTLLSRSSDPPLTTLAQPIQHLYANVVDLLIEEIEQKEPAKQRIVVLPELIIRKSTAAVKAASSTLSTPK